MNNSAVIKRTEKFVQTFMKGDSGHDWAHVNRVRKLALVIGKKEKADLFVVEIAALLHDIGDWKFHNDLKAAGKKSSKLLNEIKVAPEVVEEVAFIVDNLSWKNGTNKVKMRTLEGKVVQDADRLEALGALGVARTFSYGGYLGRPLFSEGPSSLGHIFDKVLKLKKFMNTKTGKVMAKERDAFTRVFVKHFLKEWSGER